jgi:protein translocase SecG subunit
MSIVATAIPYIQIVLAVILTAGILLQANAAGVGGAFGGGDGFGSLQTTRRGFDKVLFYTTIVVAILFVITSLIAFII